MSTTAPIETCIHNWHRHMRGDLPGGLDSLLREDCTFLSPIVFTPQEVQLGDLASLLQA